MEKYFGLFSDRESVAKEFQVNGSTWDYEGDYPVPDDFPTDDEIVFAAYVYEDYSGAAMVVFERDGKLYEVNGSHCSCYGLESQWSPEETSKEALAIRELYDYYNTEARERFHELFPVG